MGLFDFFRSKEKDKGADGPIKTPYEIAGDVKRLIKQGNLRQALDVAERGVYDHPRSEAVTLAYRFLRKRTLGEDVAALRRDVESSPSAIGLQRLAEAYKEIGDYDKALDTCHRAIERFPDHEGPWAVLAQIRMERFREDWIPHDGELAIEYFERAYDLNRNSKTTLSELAQFYTELGAKALAVKRCEAILYFAPEDERASQMLRKAQAIPDSRNDDLSSRLTAYADKKRRSLQRRSRRPGDPLGPSGRLVKEPGLLENKFERFEAFVPNYTAVVGLTLSGEVVAASIRTDLDLDSAKDSLHRLFEAANRCSLLMDIGHFKRGVIEGPSGFVYLVQFDQLRIAVMAGSTGKIDRLETAMSRFVEDELYR